MKQQAQRPLRSKYLLCSSVSQGDDWGGGRLPTLEGGCIYHGRGEGTYCGRGVPTLGGSVPTKGR